MTERVGLGASDVAVRWLGLTRLQALGAVGGVVLVADALVRTRLVAEGGLGLAALATAVPLEGATLGQRAAVALAYLGRRHWVRVSAASVGGVAVIESRRARTVRGSRLAHRGRLDLSGADHEVAAGLARLLDAVAIGGRAAVSLHVLREGTGPARTMLASDAEVAWPSGWHDDGPGLADLATAGGLQVDWLERWGYLRGPEHVAAVLRLRDVGASSARGLLATLEGWPDSTLSVHLEVLAATQGQRRAERSVHHDASERAAARGAGFRDTARAHVAASRARQREREVATGRALARLSVFLVVRADRRASLRAARAAAIARARSAGLRLERGGGRQIPWLRAQLPGMAVRASATHWVTAADLDDLCLPGHDAGTLSGGTPLGRVAGGDDFCFDPFDLYREGVVANPNIVVAGAIGTGKSTVVKMLLRRALARGRRVVVVDPKGEYAALAAHAGVAPLRLGVDGWCDPFDGASDARALARAVVAAALGQGLSVEQHFDLDEAWRLACAEGATRPLRDLARHFRGDLSPGADPGRKALALTLRRLTEGDLAGLFDGEGPALQLAGPATVLDLSALWATPALPVAALSAVAAAQRVADGTVAGYVALDEAWALLGDDAALAWLRGSWKLARARGLSHILVLHRWGDVAAVGDAGSAQREQARGLLRECESAWLMRQPADEAADMARALGLGATEVAALTGLARGEALVRYGRHRSLVRLTPDHADRGLIDTDAAMRA